MSNTTVIHIRDWNRSSSGDVYIGRGSKWGNPFRIGQDGTRAEVIQLYREWIKTRSDLLAALDELRGKRLVCYCHPLPCHGDVLTELADSYGIQDPVVRDLYHLFDDLVFSECDGCFKCCFMPWLLEQEYASLISRIVGCTLVQKSTAFLADATSCKLIKDARCSLYAARPLDCRLFPLDIIEENEVYWWVMFTLCVKQAQIKEKLIPIIPRFEALLTPQLFNQYKRQIALTKITYPPYRLRQYEKVQRVQVPE